MPKIITDARGKIVASAKEELQENGYTKLSLVDIAARSGVAVGTIYNYFKDKDELIAAVMLDDWDETIQTMYVEGELPKDLSVGIIRLCGMVRHFVSLYRGVWNRFSPTSRRKELERERHKLVRNQIAHSLQRLLELCGKEDCEDILETAAEALLAFCRAPEIEDEQICLFFERLFRE